MIFPLVLILISNIFLFKEVKAANNYEMLILAQQWPLTVCASENNKWDFAHCNVCKFSTQSTPSWTIHGLWPSNRNAKTSPKNCRTPIKFDAKSLDLKKLDEKWPNMNHKSNNKRFWKYEWEKHGTCALDLPGIDSAKKYFSKALELLDSYNVGTVILKRANILPNSKLKYDVKDVVKAIKNYLGHNIVLVCAKNKENSYLHEVRICFDKQFNLKNCYDDNQITKCGKSVIYPEIVKHC